MRLSLQDLTRSISQMSEKQGRVLVFHLVELSCWEASHVGFYRRLRHVLQNSYDGEFPLSLQLAKFAFQIYVYRKMMSPNKCTHAPNQILIQTALEPVFVVQRKNLVCSGPGVATIGPQLEFLQAWLQVSS